MKKRYKIEVDDSICAGTSTCVVLRPDLFELTDDGTSKAIIEEHDAVQLEELMSVAESCPVGAIKIKKISE